MSTAKRRNETRESASASGPGRNDANASASTTARNETTTDSTIPCAGWGAAPGHASSNETASHRRSVRNHGTSTTGTRRHTASSVHCAMASVHDWFVKTTPLSLKPRFAAPFGA